MNKPDAACVFYILVHILGSVLYYLLFDYPQYTPCIILISSISENNLYDNIYTL